MPVKDMTEKKLPLAAQILKTTIIEEWLHPTTDENQPIILLDKKAAWGTTHIFVVWDGWGDIEQQVRSEIIMDACEETLDAPERLKVTVAMGLTKKEAERLNIQYQ